MQNYHIVQLLFDHLYDNGTKPEGTILSFDKSARIRATPRWLKAHWAEVAGLLRQKWTDSQALGQNCGLIQAARHYFGNEKSISSLFDLIKESKDLSLPELSLIVQQGDEKRIFIPNIKIATTRIARKCVPYETLEAFFTSDSYQLIRNIVQMIAANPDSIASPAQQADNFRLWGHRHANRARKALEQSLDFNPSRLYVEGISPDILFEDFRHPHTGEPHPPYETLAKKVTLEKKAFDTVLVS